MFHVYYSTSYAPIKWPWKHKCARRPINILGWALKYKKVGNPWCIVFVVGEARSKVRRLQVPVWFIHFVCGPSHPEQSRERRGAPWASCSLKSLPAMSLDRTRRRINRLFGDRRHFLVVCDAGVFLHGPEVLQEAHEVSLTLFSLSLALIRASCWHFCLSKQNIARRGCCSDRAFAIGLIVWSLQSWD